MGDLQTVLEERETMILRGAMKPAAFISAIACTIARDSNARKDAEDLTFESLAQRGEGLIYLAGGYWRAAPRWTKDYDLVGVSLINPDRTPEEVRIVEQGIAILCRFDYRP